MRGEQLRASLLVFSPVTRARCETLQAACDEAVMASEKHQGSLTKQVEANKVLDNDLKMMCALVVEPGFQARDCAQVPQAQEGHGGFGRQVQAGRLWPSLRVRLPLPAAVSEAHCTTGML
jgi:hypothetical protein